MTSPTNTNTNTATITAAATEVDVRELLDRAIVIGGHAIASVRPEQLALPTPCTEMDVRALLGHLVGVLDRIAALGRDDDLFAIGDGESPDDRWIDVWNAAADSAVDAWSDDATLGRPMALPWVQGLGGELLASYLPELTVHTWDLAVATGQQPEWDDAVLKTALVSSDYLPAENRLALFEEISANMGLDEVAVPFAEAIEMPANAPAIDRLVAWNGRDPRR